MGSVVDIVVDVDVSVTIELNGEEDSTDELNIALGSNLLMLR